MKKKAGITLLLLFGLLLCLILYVNSENKCKDITNAAEQYVTTGLFNEHKLYKIDKYHLIFSDSSESIMEVTGIEQKSPHRYTTFKLNMKKNQKGIWKVTKCTIQSPDN